MPDGTLPPEIEGHTREASANIFAALDAAGMKPLDLIKISTAVIREEDIVSSVKVRKKLLAGAKAALKFTVPTLMGSQNTWCHSKLSQQRPWHGCRNPYPLRPKKFT